MKDNRELAEQEVFDDHLNSPRGLGRLSDPFITVKKSRVSCGDEVIISAKFATTADASSLRCHIQAIARGCPISRASASILCQLMEGLDFEVCRYRTQLFDDLMRNKLNESERLIAIPELGDCFVLESIKGSAARIPCVLLSWNAFSEALQLWKKEFR
jgi:NifU-like protein involved in Fe-S cluster formation